VIRSLAAVASSAPKAAPGTTSGAAAAAADFKMVRRVSFRLFMRIPPWQLAGTGGSPRRVE
jgi:hypothetical protein